MLDFHVLGALDVVRNGARIALGGFRQRAVLAALIAHANEVIPPASLIDLVWTDPPATADGTLYNYISRLRAAMDERSENDWRFLRREEGGYVLRVDPERIDAERFTAKVAEARLCRVDGRGEDAVAAYRTALVEWRDRPYAGFDAEPFAAPVIAGLEQLYVGASIELAEQELEIGLAGAALERLEPLVSERPLDGSIRVMHARALVAAGRAADAVRSIDEYGTQLAEETGMDPGEEVRELRLHILRQHVSGPPDAPSPMAASPEPSVVGREAELQRLRSVLSPGSIVTLTGPAGVGKSTLARAALASAHRLHMPLYELVWDKTTTPQRTLVDQLGLESDPAADPVDVVGEFLMQRHGIVLFDGVENHRADALRLVEQLRSSTAKHITLITSREALGHPDEEVLLVAPLDRPAVHATDGEVWEAPSAQVFLRRALRVRPDFRKGDDTSTAVARICQAVDGLPLALELAASSLDVQSVEQVAARCEELSGIVGGQHASEEAIRTAFLLSYQHLPTQERTLFRRLTIISGAFSLEAAQLVGGLGSSGPELLRGLIRASMVLSLPAVDGQPMFRILEPLRRFGRAELLTGEGQGGIEHAYERLAAHFRAFAAQVEPGLLGSEQRSWSERTHAQLDALLDLLYHEGSSELRDVCRGIVEDLWWASPTWTALLRAATDVLGEPRDEDHAWTTFCRGFLALCRGEYDGAQMGFELALARADEDWRTRTAAKIGLSSVARDLTRFEDARRWASEALDEATEHRLRWWIARSLYSLALVNTETGDVAEAERLLDEARVIYADINDATSVIEADLTAMWALANDGQFEASWARMSSYAIAPGSVYDAESRAQIAGLEAKNLLGLGKPEAARAAAMRAVVGFWDLSQDFYVAKCLELVAAALAQTDQPEDALHMQLAADDLRARIGTPRNPSEDRLCGETMQTVGAILGDRVERVRRRFVGISLDEIVEHIRVGGQGS